MNQTVCQLHFVSMGFNPIWGSMFSPPTVSSIKILFYWRSEFFVLYTASICDYFWFLYFVRQNSVCKHQRLPIFPPAHPIAFTAFCRWRFTLIKPEEFTVRGTNYVADMATDMAFLATGFSILKDQFRMDLGTGNPFALPSVYVFTATNGIAAKPQNSSKKVSRLRAPSGRTIQKVSNKVGISMRLVRGRAVFSRMLIFSR